MAHQIEIVDGRAKFVASRVPGWHGLGQVFDRNLTVAEAMTEAGLTNWNIRTAPVFAIDGDNHIEVEGTRVVLRDNQTTPGGAPESLGAVTPVWTPIQIEDGFQFGEALLTLGDRKPNVSAAGSLEGGKSVFLTLELPDHIVIGDGDLTIPYLLVMMRNDGKGALVTQLDYIRAVCANTVSAAMNNTSAMRHTVRHAGEHNWDALVLEASQALNLAYKAMDQFTAEAQAMAKQKVTDAMFDKIVADLFPIPADDIKGRAKMVSKQDAFRQVYALPTQDGIRGTAWGVLQAGIEMADWFVGSDDPTARARSQAGLNGKAEGSAIKAQVRKSILTVTK
jgi:phage/plasmid-like protein (TIGR03299 family)